MLNSPAPRNVLLVALALGALAAASVGLAGKKPPQRIEFEPQWDPEQEVLDQRGPLLEGNTWIVRDDRFTARLTQLDDDQRWRYIKAKTKAEVDPFMDTDMDSPGFLTFALELKSKVDGNLVLRPERCRLITNRKEFRHAMDIVTIETAYRLQEADVPPAYYAAEPALVPSEVISHIGMARREALDSLRLIVKVMLPSPVSYGNCMAPVRTQVRYRTGSKQGNWRG